MINTRLSNSQEGVTNVKSLAQQLSAIVSKLNTSDSLAADVPTLKAHTSCTQQEESSHGNRNKGKSVWQDEEEDIDRDALDLFSWINRVRTLLYWEELVKALQKKYGPAEFQNPNEHLCNIQLTSYVQEYRQEFAKHSSRVTNWLDHCLLGVFVNGFKEELKSDVRIHKPRTVYRAMTASQPLQTRTWDTERRNLMGQGHCFGCHDKFAPGHRCKSAKLSLMEITGEGQLEEVDEVNAVIGDNPQENDLAEISFHAILGQSVGATMKLQGEINGKEVLILVDSGSTHNFVADSIVEEHNIPVEMVSTFGVQIRNGDIIHCNKVCRNLQIQLLGFTITQDYYPFAIGGADLIFGIKWLASLIRFKLTGRIYGVAMDSEKIYAVLEWPVPKNVKKLHGFLGLTGYYRHFVKNYGIIARPLTKLTKKDAFTWHAKVEQVFQNLKRILTSVPVLRLPDFTQQLTVECDASSDGVGAILLQHCHPVAYFSKEFSFSSRIKSTYDCELLALVFALQKWKHYLLGRHFIVTTDHCSLKYLLHQREVKTKELIPYLVALNMLVFLSLVIPIPLDFSDLTEAIEADPYTKQIQDQLSSDPSIHPNFSLSANYLYYKSRLVIPDYPKLKVKILTESHDSPTGGHRGYLKTLKRVSTNFFWPCLKHDVKSFVQNCLICHQHKYETLAPAGLLQPLPIPNKIWEDISLDFIIGLPPSNPFDTILVVVDRFSKYNHFLALTHPFTAKTVVGVFYKEIVRLHGLSRSILSDRDVVFTSAFWQELFCLSRTRLRMGTSYHPQSYGQTEVVNQCLETYLVARGTRSNVRGTMFQSHEGSIHNELLETSKVHHIFHVSLLHPARGCYDIASPSFLPLSGELEFMVEPKKVLSHRWVKESGVPTLELLIQWHRRPVEEASWEDYDLLAVQFPLFCLEDKASFQGDALIPTHISRRTLEENIDKRIKS
ncbi:hypothetical protein KY290_001069 [Solanum tuberosum]|uniref:Integrase catalytic domain-containing protein n=1 Tax=Solanum tuberosum TaxID=4113 RepID=A0ABQ7WMG0_SOLTU|nr:hypothetical protein KY290_001069 [Solanum tuberosum]